MGLFRTEALEAKKSQMWGRAILVQPISLRALTIIIMLVTLAAGIFLVRADYARTEAVAGYLSPTQGIVQVMLPRAGVVQRVAVQSGDIVRTAQTLLIIDAEQRDETGQSVDQAVLKQLDQQILEIDEQIAQEIKRSALEQQRLEKEQAGLQAEQTALVEEKALILERIKASKEALDALEPLIQKGFAPVAEQRRRKDIVLSQRQTLAAVERQAMALNREIETRGSAIAQAPLTQAERLSRLQSSRAQIEAQRVELLGRQALQVAAPINGRIGAVHAVTGSSADMTRPAVTILPEGSDLRADLYVPTRAAGFLALGQTVRLKYDAFPYRRFGLAEGVVDSIDATVLTPAQAASASISVTEPVYRVKVRLAR